MPDKKYLIEIPGMPEGSGVWDSDKWERNKDAFMADYPEANIFELGEYDAEDTNENDQIMLTFENDPDSSGVWDSAKWERNKEAFTADHPEAKVNRVRYVDYWGNAAQENRAKREELSQPDSERDARLANLGYYDDMSGQQKDFSLENNTVGLKPVSSAVEQNSVSGEMTYHDPKLAEFYANDSAHTERMAEIARLDAEYDSNPSVIAQREWEQKARAEQEKYIDDSIASIREDINAEVNALEAGKGAFYKTASSQGMGDVAIMQQAIEFMKGKDASQAYVENEKLETYTSAAKLFEKAKQAYDVAGKGFWGATADVGMDKLRDLATQSDIEAYNQIGDILTRLETRLGSLDEVTDKDIESNLSKEEQALIKGFFAYNEAMSNAQQDMSQTYKGGKIFGESISFMLEFLATGGLAGGTGKAAGNAVGKGLVKWAAKAAKGTAQRAARTVATKATRALTSAAVGTLARTVAAPGTYQRMAEESTKIEDGHLNQGKNAFKAFTDSYIENLSEISGGVIGKSLKIAGINPSKILGSISFGKVGKMLADNSVMQAIAKGGKALFGENGVLKKFGFNGIFEEVEEEYIGNLIRELTIQPGALEEMHKDGNFGAMIIGFAPMTLFGAGMSAASIGAKNIEAANLGKKLRKNLSSHYTDQQIDHMMNLVSGAENAEQVWEAIRPLTVGLNAEETQQLYQYGAFMAQNKAMLFAKKAQEDNLAQAKRAEAEHTYGKFWQENAEGAESVQLATLNDGRSVFVLSEPTADGVISIIDAKTGEKGFTNVSNYKTQEVNGEISPMTQQWSMDAYLEGSIAADRMTAEQARMTREYDGQVKNLQSQIQEGTQINLGTEGSPVILLATGKFVKDGVVAVDQTGNTHTVGWNQVADAMGQPIIVKTDQQIVDEEIAGIVARNAERRKKMSNTTPAMTEAVNESAAQTSEAVAQETKHIPLNEDGTVNEAAFWTQDPEGYVKWNDEQNKDGGQDSLRQIAISKQELMGMLAEVATRQNTSNPTMRKAAEKEVQIIAEKIARLEALEMFYADALAEEKVAVQKTAATPTAEMSEEQLEQMDAQYQGILGKTRVQSERVRVMQEYLNKLAEESFPVVVLTRTNYAEKMKKEGCEDSRIKIVERYVNLGKSIGGFTSNGKLFLMEEGLPNVNAARVTYVHERQHVLNTENPRFVQALVEAAGGNRELLAAWVKSFVGKEMDVYKSLTPEGLADELICRSMEIAYTSEEFSVDLQSKGIPSEVISIITEIDNEQRTSTSLANARRRGRRNENANVNIEGRVKENGRDSGQISGGILGNETVGSSGSSNGGTSAGSTGEGAEVTPKGPSFRITPEQDEEYLRAVENGDVEKAQQMVSAAAEQWAKDSKVRDEYGNLAEQYHGSRDFGFTIFNTDPKTQNLGSHFGTAEAAKVFDGKGDKTYRVYLNITNPWVPRYEDFWTNEDQVYAAAVADLANNLAQAGNEEAAQIYKEVVAEYPMAENDETLDEWFLLDNRGDTYTGAETLHPRLRRLLEIGGYDGVRYNNWYEDEGNDSWVALYPEQIKSAESATFDDNNKLIPLSERFSEGVDLRFRTASTNPEVNLTEQTRQDLAEKGLVMDGGAIMSEDYAILKHELGYQTPIERNTDLDQIRFSIGTKDRHIANYRNHPDFEERVVEVLERLAERMTMNELVHGVVSTTTKHTYGKKLSGSVAGPLRSNQEYIITFDLDTSCPRTFQYLNLVKKIEKRIGRPLTQVESIQLIEIMRMYGQQIPCVYCYAENKRQALKQYYADFIEARHGVLAAATDEEALKYMYGHKKVESTDPKVALNDAAYKVFVEWRKNPKSMYNPTIRMIWSQYTNDRNSVLTLLDTMYEDKGIGVNTSDSQIAASVAAEFGVTNAKAIKVIEEIVAEWKWDIVEGKEHDQYTPVDEDDWGVNEKALEVWRDMTSYAKSASSAKSVIRYTPYTDELKEISQEDKDYINGMGGVRMHSSNDFRIDYVYDYFQFMADMALYKMFGHTYTKSPEFVRIFGNSGYKINMSIAAYQDENGNIRPNADEGFDWNEAQTLRQLFPNAGTMLMATSDEQIQMALDSDWIDMCIPFHHSGLPKAVWYNMRLWSDYTAIQKELFLNSTEMKDALKADGVLIPKKAKASDIADLYNEHFGIKVLYDKTGKRIRPHFLPGPTIVDGHNIPGHNNDHQRYLDLCKEYGVKPRFAGMQVRDNSPEGGGRVVDVTEHPRYMIFIKETARTDSPQTPIQFNFDQPSEALGGKTPIEYAFDELEARAMAESELEGENVKDIYNSLKKDQFGIADHFIKTIIKHKEETGEDYPLDYLTPESREWFMVERRALEEAFKDVETIPYHRNEYDEQGNLAKGQGLEAIDLIEEAKKAQKKHDAKKKKSKKDEVLFRVISQEKYDEATRRVLDMANQTYFKRVEGEYELGKLADNYAELADLINVIDEHKIYRPVGSSILGFFANNPSMHFPLLLSEKSTSKEAAKALEEELAKVNDVYALRFMKDAWRIHKDALVQVGLGVKPSATNKYNKAIDKRIEDIKAADVKGTAYNFKKQESSLDEIDALFKELNKDADLALLHDKVLDLARTLGVKVSFAGKRGSTAGESLGDKVSYDYKYFNSPAIPDQNKCQTITHELIHSVTTYAIYISDKAPGMLTDGMLKAVGILRDVYDQIAKDAAFKGEYGVTDVYEMVAELSNAKFRDKLKEKNLFQRILDALKRLLGIDTVKEDSAYQVLSDTLDYIIDNYDQTAFDAYANYASRSRSYGRMMKIEETPSQKSLTNAVKTIKKWLKDDSRGGVFSLPLPESTASMIRKEMGRDYDSHNITANGIAHALKNHGESGLKLSENSIPVTKENAELIPYIMVAPDYIEKGSTDLTGRESIKFFKNLSNGYVVVVEKEYKNSPDDMETINMWAEMSSKATNAQQNAAPGMYVQNAILSTDAAKIRKDAEDAILLDNELRKTPPQLHKNVSFRITAEQDKAYMDAVERGDMETAQRMVLEAAKLAMPNTKVVDEDGNPKVVYHGTSSRFYTFRDTSDSNELGAGYYFSDSYEMAERYAKDENLADNREKLEDAAFGIFVDEMGLAEEDFDNMDFIDDYNVAYARAVQRMSENGHVKSVFLNIEKPRILSRNSPDYDPYLQYGFNHYNEGQMAKRFNDGVIDEMFEERHKGLTGTQYVAFKPSQIKSAEPVTYDDAGNVIPLSQRFNPDRSDIRFSIRSAEQRDKLFDKAKEKFGITNNFKVAGYMLPDGSLLDFSEANNGGNPNQRSLDHREIEGIIMDEGKEYDSRWMYLADFMNEGAIRLLPEYAGINLMKAPTKEQRQKLFDFIYKYNGEVILEIADERLNNVAYVEYDLRTSPSRIFRDIDGYFNEGIVPQQDVRFSIANENQAIFVSNAARAVEGIKMEKATPEQWLKMIEKSGGLKAGEDKWMGLSDWLKASDKKTLAKAEVLDFINENKIVIDEQHYSNKGVRREADKILDENYPGWEEAFSFDWDPFMEEPHADIYDEVKAARLYNETHEDQVETDEDGDIVNDADYNKVEEFGAELAGIWHGRGRENTVREIHGTREDYTTFGLTNLHEIALTVPSIESWNEEDDIHFGDAGEGRAVAWVRFGETWERRPSPQISRKVLVIDEIQSKRHQEGREKGYTTRNIMTLESLAREATAAVDDFIANHPFNLTQKEKEELSKLKSSRDLARQEYFEEKGKIPDAPFDKNWHELAMKRMLRYAAENGYDVIAWTKGDQQAERYNIGDVVTSVDYRLNDDGTYHVDTMGRNGYQMDEIPTTFGSETELAEIFGKEIARKIAGNLENDKKAIAEANEEIGELREWFSENVKTDESDLDSIFESVINNPEQSERWNELEVKKEEARRGHSLSETDFRIGGEGMKGFYDRMLPSFMNKYGKKWGVKVEDIDLSHLESGRIMHSVPVTEEMKESVMEGQVMFSISDNAARESYGRVSDATFRTDANITPAEWKGRLKEYGMTEEDDALLGMSEWLDSLDEVTADNYYVATKTSFERVRGAGKDSETWKTMKENLPQEGFAFKRSPYSSSEYLVNAETGEVYRFADHWFNVGSCDWGIDDASSGVYYARGVRHPYPVIGKSNLADFSRKKMDGRPIREQARKAASGVLFRATGIIPEVRDEMDRIAATAIIDGNYMLAPNGQPTKLTADQWAMGRTKNFKRWFGDWENDPENASKVIDENGEPMVVYHGSPNEFNTFDEEMIGDNTDSGFYGRGFYFATTEEEARGYGEHVIPAFLNIQNPLDLNEVYAMSDKWDGATADGAVRWWYGLASIFPNDAISETAYASIGGEDWTIKDLKNRIDELAETSDTPFADAAEEFGIDEDFFDMMGEADVNLPDELTDALRANGYDGVINAGAENNEIVVLNPNQIKSATGNNGEFSSENDDIRFSIRTKPAPEKIGTGYKVFYLKDGKLYPPMVANPNGADTPVLVWLDADAAPQAATSKTGRKKVKAGGKGTQGGAGTLAYRPGWHLGKIPYALQFNRGPKVDNPLGITGKNGKVIKVGKYFPANFVWAEVEYANDVDYQDEAMSYGYNEAGNFQHSLAGLPKIPEDGSYIYRTNANPATDPWIITGAMKVKRLLTPSEVDQMVIDAGREPQKRQEGAVTDAQIEALNKELGLVEEEEEVSFRVTGTPTDEVVANGLQLTPAQTAGLAADIFAALPEESRKKITEGLGGNILGLQDAIMQIPASLATKESWNDEDVKLANAVRSVMQDAVDKKSVTSRPLTTKEALWMLYRSTAANGSDLISAARRSLVAHNLGFDPRSERIREMADDHIRFSVVRNNMIDSATDMYNYEASLWTSRLKESWLDMNQSVISLQNALAEASGKPIESWEDVVLALNQLSSKSYADKKKYMRDFLEPLWDVVLKITKATDYRIENIERYMMLKHALERNLAFAKRDAREYYETAFRQSVAAIEGNESLSDADKQKQIDKAQKALDKHLQDIDAGTDAKFLEFREKDYGGLTSMFVDFDRSAVRSRSSYKSEEAYQQAVIAATRPRYDNVADMEDAAKDEVDVMENDLAGLAAELWDKINAATKEVLRHQHASGMITTEQYNAVRNMFQHYVPLRGFADNTAEDMYSYYMNNSSNGFAMPIIGAKGRKTKAESPLGWIGTMAESAIQADNKNDAKIRLYYALLNRPDTGVLSIAETWYEYTGQNDANGRKIFAPVYPPATGKAMTADELRQHMDTWESSMMQKQAAGNAFKGNQSVNLRGSVVFQDTKEDKEHIIRVKVAGKDYSILVNGNPRAAQAINGLLNPDANVGPVGEWVGNLRRNMSALMTSFSPLFWVSNYQRDLLSSFMRTSESEGWKQAFKYMNNRRKAWRVASYIYKNDKGRLGNSYYENLYKEFAENGGITGYTSLTTNKEYEKLLEEYAQLADKPIRKWIKNAWNNFMGFGEAIEQVSRYAAFITAREAGKSIEEAVNAAKEVSVNFNRKGSAKPLSLDEIDKLRTKDGKPLNKAQKAVAVVLTAMPKGMKELYFFFNASIQALSSSAKLAKQSPGKATAWAGMYMGLSMALAAINYLISGDDDEEEYLDLPDYARRSNALVKISDEYYLKWSLPQEMRPFYAIADIILGKAAGNMPHKNVGKEIALAMAEWLPVNPFGTDDPLLSLVPDFAAPLAEIKANKNFVGGKIYDDMAFKSEGEKENIPAYRKATSKTGKIYIEVAEVLNAISGGDEVQKGAININPAVVEHLVEGYGGGLYDFAKLMVSFPAMLISDEDVEVRNIPFVNKVVMSVDETNMYTHTNEVFYHYRDIAENAERVEKEYRNSDDPSKADAYRKEEDWRIHQLFEQYDSELKEIKDKLKNAADKEEEDLLRQEQNAVRELLLNDIATGKEPDPVLALNDAIKEISKEISAIKKPFNDAEKKRKKAKESGDIEGAQKAKKERDEMRKSDAYKTADKAGKDLKELRDLLDEIKSTSLPEDRDSLIAKFNNDYQALKKKLESK